MKSFEQALAQTREVEATPVQADDHAADASLGRQALSQAVHGAALPDQLARGVEALSGVSMDGVRVHYNSPQPAQLQAHAFARGHDIHVGPGQEQHLPHEAWHVVQQSQGRAAPTTQLKGVTANTDAALEREADEMGARAARGADAAGRVATADVTPQVAVVQLDNGADQTGDTTQTTQQTLPEAITAALRERRAQRQEAVTTAIDAASVDEVRALAADRRQMRRMQRSLGFQGMAAARGAMARKLHAEGDHVAAFQLLTSPNRRLQRMNLEAFGSVQEQRALEDGVITSSQDDALVERAFSLYWDVRLRENRGRIDRDGSGGRGPNRMRSEWTADRLRAIHDQLKRLPEQDVRIDALAAIHLVAGEGGGWYNDGTRQFGLGADVSNSGQTTHHLAVAAARRARSITLDAVTNLQEGATITISGGGNREEAAIRQIDASTRVVQLQHRLLNGYPEGAMVLSSGGIASFRMREGHLAQDEAAGATTLHLNAVTGFEVGDELVIDDDDQRTIELRTVCTIDTTQNTLTIQPGLARGHVRGSTVRRSNQTAVDYVLTAAAAVGDTTLALITVRGLPDGADLMLCQGTPNEERVSVASTDATTNQVTLSGALTHAHAEGIEAVRVPPTAAGSGYTVATATQSDAETLDLNSVAGLGARDGLVIDAGQATEEHCRIASIDTANNRLTLADRLVFRHAVGATVGMHGGHDMPRLTGAVAAGATDLALTAVDNLHVGESITLSFREAVQEDATIQSIAASSRTVTIAAGLTNAHPAQAMVVRTGILPGNRAGNVPWMDAVVRHEIAHALDAQLGAAIRPFKRDVGGWRESTDFDAWAGAMGQPWQTRSGTAISAADQRRIKRHIVRRMRTSGGQELNRGLNATHPIQQLWSEDVPVIEAAKMTRHGDSFWSTPISIKIYNGNAFAINHYYNHFQYCKAEVHQQRVRDYSSFSAAEFFAEVYSVFYEEAGQTPEPTPGRLLPVAAWRDWMTTNIHERGQTPQAATAAGTTSPGVGMAANNAGET